MPLKLTVRSALPSMLCSRSVWCEVNPFYESILSKCIFVHFKCNLWDNLLKGRKAVFQWPVFPTMLVYDEKLENGVSQKKKRKKKAQPWMWWLLVARSTSMWIFWFILWQCLPNPCQVFQQKVLIVLPAWPIGEEIHEIWSFRGKYVKLVVKKRANITWIKCLIYFCWCCISAPCLLYNTKKPSKPLPFHTHRQVNIWNCML